MARTPHSNERIAYDAGWRASERATTDLDRAEARFDRRGIPDPRCMFSAGWIDYAVGDRPKWYTLDRELGTHE